MKNEEWVYIESFRLESVFSFHGLFFLLFLKLYTFF